MAAATPTYPLAVVGFLAQCFYEELRKPLIADDVVILNAKTEDTEQEEYKSIHYSKCSNIIGVSRLLCSRPDANTRNQKST
ncbi:hypothetical protein EI291_10855 [Hymenobacter rigui]|uniref:Uncharacterized protein n=1 Tax=Hymenobacter rigui TaxID=334424 RepID=A0A3R9N607_9BACT|nr:hypothetical protein EI291_10855 [Hymenobacter rigui]